MEFRVFASIDREQLLKKADDLGLSVNAGHYLSYFTEVALMLEINHIGEVVNVTAPDFGPKGVIK